MNRLRQVQELVDRADFAYYQSGAAIMDDDVYDALKEELRALNPSDERFSRVGAFDPAGSPLTKRRHAIPMGSQNKAANEDEFQAWVASLPSGTRLHGNLKMDGASVAIDYVQGELFRAVTRGDGLEGEDITHNARHFKQLPRTGVMLDGKPFTGHVRAEVMLTVADWKLADPELGKNPRNLGTGISRRKDGEQAGLLSAFAFRAYGADQREVRDSETAMEAALREMGFVAPPSCAGAAEDILAFYRATSANRSALGFWIDGVVVKVDALPDQLALGVVNQRPKGMIAFKFPPAGEDTVLRSVEITVGHTGAIIPTAKFDPVQIGGTTVGSALLCNWQEIEALDVAIGDTVRVVKRGDIIPKIIAVSLRPECRQPIPEPTRCPVCAAALVRRTTVSGDDSAMHYCPSEQCGAKVLGKLGRWLTALNILGVGDEVLLALNQAGLVSDVADLYRLKDRAAELAALRIGKITFGESRATKLIAQIEAKRDLALDEFIGALGVDGVAQRRVELIRQAVPGQMDTLADWQGDKLIGLAEAAGVPNLAAGIVAGLKSRADLIGRLLAAGVMVRSGAAVTAPAAGALSFCITGALSRPRDHFVQLITAKGHVMKDGVSKGLTYLVMADPTSTSSKAEKARKLGTKCIGETELLAILGESAP